VAAKATVNALVVNATVDRDGLVHLAYKLFSITPNAPMVAVETVFACLVNVFVTQVLLEKTAENASNAQEKTENAMDVVSVRWGNVSVPQGSQETLVKNAKLARKDVPTTEYASMGSAYAFQDTLVWRVITRPAVRQILARTVYAHKGNASVRMVSQALHVL